MRNFHDKVEELRGHSGGGSSWSGSQGGSSGSRGRDFSDMIASLGQQRSGQIRGSVMLTNYDLYKQRLAEIEKQEEARKAAIAAQAGRGHDSYARQEYLNRPKQTMTPAPTAQTTKSKGPAAHSTSSRSSTPVTAPDNRSTFQRWSDQILGVDSTQVTGGKTDWGKAAQGAVYKGMDQAAAGMVGGLNTLDSLGRRWMGKVNPVASYVTDELRTLGKTTLNDIIGGINDIAGTDIGYIQEGETAIEHWLGAIKKEQAQNQAYFAQNANTSRAAQIVDKYGTSFVAAIPQAIEALMFGKAQAVASAGAQLPQAASAAMQYAGRLANSSGLGTAGIMAQEGMKNTFRNPQFWTSYLEAIGGGYESAKEDGMSDEDAELYSLVNGFLNAVIEIGGGDEDLGGFQSLPRKFHEAAGEEGKHVVLDWIKDSVLGEGWEEVQQGIIERGLLQSAQGASAGEMFSLDPNNTKAAFNPWTAAEEFTGGAVVGGLLGGGETGILKGAQAISDSRAYRGDTQTLADTAREAGGEGTAARVDEIQQAAEKRGKMTIGQARELYGIIEENNATGKYEQKAKQKQLAGTLQSAFRNSDYELTDDQAQEMAARYDPSGDVSMTDYVIGAREAYDMGYKGVRLMQAKAASDYAPRMTDEQFNRAWAAGATAKNTVAETADTNTEEGKTRLAAALNTLGAHAAEAEAAYDPSLDVNTFAAAMNKAAALYAANGMDLKQIVQDARDGKTADIVGRLTDAQVETAARIGKALAAEQAQSIKQSAAQFREIRQQAAAAAQDLTAVNAALQEAKQYGQSEQNAFKEGLASLEAMVKADPSIEGTEAYNEAYDKLLEHRKNVENMQKAVKELEAKRAELQKQQTGKRKKGTVSLEGGEINGVKVNAVDRSKLSRLQKKVVAMVEALADAVNIDYVLFDGDAKGTQGAYTQGGTIYLNINAGMATGKSLAAATLSHELTHYLQEYAPEEYAALREFLTKEVLNKTPGQLDAMVRRQLRLEPNLDYDEAMNEVIANACQRMLLNSKAVRELARQNMTLAEKIADVIADLSEKIHAAFEEAGSDDVAFRDTVKAVEAELDRVQALWDNALKAASENYNAEQEIQQKETRLQELTKQSGTEVGEYDLKDFQAAVGKDGKPLFQVFAMEHDEDRYREMLTKWGGMSIADIDKLFLAIDVAMDKIKSNLEALDYAWEADIDDRGFNPVKPNSDPLYKISVDFSTLCRKRILQGAVQNQLQAALNRALTREEGIAIRDALVALQEEGKQIEVACALCYVESARMRSPAQIQKFLNDREAVLRDFFAGKTKSTKQLMNEAEAAERQKIYEEYESQGGVRGKGDDNTLYDVRNAKKAPLKRLPDKLAERIRNAKKAVKAEYKFTPEQQKIIDAAKAMNVTDFTTPEGLENLAKNHREIFDAYTSFIRNATNSKGIENDTWWRAGDSSKVSDLLIEQMNRENGTRTQSWSDFQVKHLMDYIAATIELATRGAKQHAYTKVIDYVDLMGDTGVMINMSLIPTREFNGTLRYDDVEGFVYKEALRLREKYHATAGTICIGVDNEQIRQLLASDVIDYIIPYHHSGMAKHTRKAMRIPNWTDYQDFQNEKALKGAEAQKNAERFGVKLLDESDPNWHKHTKFSDWFDLERAKAEAKAAGRTGEYGVMTGGYAAMQAAAENYKKLCAERGLAPKFSYGRADFSGEDNYWKLLIDRKMVDNVTGDVIEQMPIKPQFDIDTIQRILDDELERYGRVKEDQNEATRRVTEAFLGGKIKGGMKFEDVQKAMQKPVDNISITNITQNAAQLQTWEMESTQQIAEAALEDNEPAVAESGTQMQVWTDEPPKRVQYGFKLMNVDENGLPHAMFIDAAKPYEFNTWYTADSPKLENLIHLEPGYCYLIDENDNADMATRRQFKKTTRVNKKGQKQTGYSQLPSVGDINRATNENKRWMLVDRYADGGVNIQNLGINGSGAVSKFALRPGIHAVDIPSMTHIGAEDKVNGGKKRRPDQRWFLIEYPVDVDYNQEAYSHESKDIRDHLPDKGWYSFQTNSGAEAKQHWFITGGMKIVGAISEADARRFAKERGYNDDLQWRDGKTYSEDDSIDLDEYVRTTKAEPTPSKDEMRQRIEAGRVQYQKIGVREDGIEVYETSEEIKKLPWKQRKQKFIELMSTEYRGRTAKFVRNGHTYYARFDGVDIQKNVYGDNESDDSGRDAKINAGASGDIFDLVENAEWFGGEVERGKSGKAHKDVMYWDYFLKTVQIDNKVFDLLANVRQKTDDSFVYNLELYERNDIEAASPPSHSDNGKASLGVPTASGLIIPDTAAERKTQSQVWNEEYGEYIPYNRRAIVAEETLDRWMDGEHFGASNPNYAQAYITYMKPEDFLHLSTIYDMGRIRSETELLDEEKLKASVEYDPIKLIIDSTTGEVLDHEGRHRMMALMREDVTRVPVLLFDFKNKNSKVRIDSLMLHGQEFNGMRNSSTALAIDLIPLNKAHRDIIVQKFSTQESFERSKEKLGIGRQMRFQVWDDTFDDTASEANDRELAYTRLQSENAILSESVAALKKLTAKKDTTIGKLQDQLRLTKAQEVREADARKLAKQLLKDNSSQADLTEITEQLKALGDYILQTPVNEVSEQEIKDRARSIASEIVDNAVERVTVEDETMLQIAKDLKGRKLTIDPQFHGELDGGFQEFRKRMMGKLTIASADSTRIDRSEYSSVSQYYADLQSEYGQGYFPDLANEGEELSQIARVFDLVQPIEVNPFDRYEAEVTEELANRIAMDALGGIMRVTPPTFADKQKARRVELQEQIKQLKAEQKLDAKEAGRLYQTIYDLSVALDKAESKYRTLRTASDYRLAQARREGSARALEIKAAERARAAEQISSLKAHYREMQERASERRQNTATRNKIRKLIADLNKRLAHPTESRHVPRELMQMTLDVLNMIDLDTGRGSTKVAERIADIRAMYDSYRNNPTYQIAYDETVADMLNDLETAIHGMRLVDMNDRQLTAVYNVLKGLTHVIDTAVKVRIGNEERNAFEMAKEMTAETRGIPKAQQGWLREHFLPAHLRADVAFRRFAGHKKGSTWEKVARMLNDGQLKQTRVKMELSRPFEKIFSDQQALTDFTGVNWRGKIDESKLVDIGLKDADGNAILLTHDLMVSIYMDLLNEENRRHFIRTGKTIPNLQDYYDGKGGWGAGSVRSAGIAERLSELNHSLTEAKRAGYGDWADQIQAQIDDLMSEGEQHAIDVQRSIEEQLTDFDRQWIEASQQLMDVDSKRELNATTMEVYGIEKASVPNYWPITTDPDFLSKPMETVVKDMSLENVGFMKERIGGANPTLALGTVQIVTRQIDRVAQYCGIMPAVRAFGKIWSKTEAGYADSLKKSVRTVFQKSGVDYIENLIADLQGSRSVSADDLGLDALFGKLRGNLAQSTLTLNPRVALAQAASFPTAAAEVGWKNLGKALARGGKGGRMISAADQELIAKWSPLLWYRMQGFSTPELGDIQGNNDPRSRLWRKARWLTGWIQAVDGATVGRLWYAAEYWVQEKKPTLEKGSDAYYEAVAEKFNAVVEKTQPNYTPMQRASILRSPSSLIKTFTMFMTQRLQNMNIVYDAAASYQKQRADLAAKRNGVTQADVEEARHNLLLAASSQLVQTAVFVGIKFATDALLRSLKGYRDKDTGDLTEESVSAKALDMFIDAMAGSFVGGSELYTILKALTGQGKWYGLSVSGVDTVNDLVDSLVKLAEANKDLSDPENRQKLLGKLADVGANLAQAFGIPAANAAKIGNALKWYALDAAAGKLGATEAGFERTIKQLKAKAAVDAGIPKNLYKKTVEEANTDGDGLSQDELGTYLRTETEAGRITPQQADIIWSSQGWKTDYETWTAKTEKAEAKQAALEAAVEKASLTVEEYETLLESVDAAGDQNDEVSQDELGTYLNGEVSARRMTKQQAEAIWSTKGYKTDYDAWSASAAKKAEKSAEKEAAVSKTGLTVEEYDALLKAANTDGNTNTSQDELGTYLRSAIRTGKMTKRQADAVWNTKGWKTSLEAWSAKH